MFTYYNHEELPNNLDGFLPYDGEEPFEDLAGPFLQRLDAVSGRHLSAFIAEKRHTNGGGALHGGMLMAFADYALFVIAHDVIKDHICVTVSCHTDFVRGVVVTGPVFAVGEVTRNTRSLVFIRGEVLVKDVGVLATFTGIIKRVGVN